MHTFYNGLSDSARTIINASAEGALMKKTTDQAYEILEDTTTNTNHWPRVRSAPRKSLAGIDTEVLSNLVNHVAQLTKQQGIVNAIQNNPWDICESCGGQHSTMDCQPGKMTLEQAQFVNQLNQQHQGQYGGNTYQNRFQNQNHNQGQGWRGNQNNQSNQNYGWRNYQNSMPPLQASKSPPEKKVDLEEALAYMMTSHSTFMNETKARFQNQAQ